MDFDIALQPKELELLDLMERDDTSLIGYGGAKGGAKSHAARSVAIIRRLKYPGTRALVYRRNYDDLWQQHIQMIAEEWPELFAKFYSAENKALMLPHRSMVLFRYADSFKDIMTFRGKEYGDVFIDEATELQETELKILYSSCRTTIQGFRPKKVLTFNPGGVGHSYVKRVFIDKEPTREEKSQNPQFIQAYAWDNAMWVRESLRQDGFTIAQYREWTVERQIEYLITRSDYGKELNALPEDLRKAWLYGDWDTFAGQQFSEWRRAVHVVQPFQIPSWWTRWIGNDPGFTDPSAWYWFAADEHGFVYVYRERTFVQKTASEQAREVAEIIEKAGERISFIVTGMDAFVTNDRSVGKTDVDYYEQAGLRGFRRPVHGTDARSARAKTVHEYLRAYDYRPEKDSPPAKVAKLRVFDQLCPKLIQTLPALPMDENNPEAVKECNIDHWYDALGYGLQAWHADRATLPKRSFLPGSAGDLLGHAAILEPEQPRGPFGRAKA